MAAVLAVGLGEHHQLDISRVAPESAEAFHQVVDLVGCQSEAQGQIGCLDGTAATAQHVDGLQRPRLGVDEQALGVSLARQHGFGHTVVQGSSQRRLVVHRTRDGVPDASLDAADALQAAIVGHISGLGRPGRNGTNAGNDEQTLAVKLASRRARAVAEHACQHALFSLGQGRGQLHEMDELGGKG